MSIIVINIKSDIKGLIRRHGSSLYHGYMVRIVIACVLLSRDCGSQYYEFVT